MLSEMKQAHERLLAHRDKVNETIEKLERILDDDAEVQINATGFVQLLKDVEDIFGGH
jgi:prefoldin subunit 5